MGRTHYEPLLLSEKLSQTAFYRELQDTSANIRVTSGYCRGAAKHLTFDMPTIEAADAAVKVLGELCEKHGTKASHVKNTESMMWSRHWDPKGQQTVPYTQGRHDDCVRMNRVTVFVGNPGMASFVDKIIAAVEEFYAGNAELQAIAKGPKTGVPEPLTADPAGWAGKSGTGMAAGGRGA